MIFNSTSVWFEEFYDTIFFIYVILDFQFLLVTSQRVQWFLRVFERSTDYCIRPLNYQFSGHAILKTLWKRSKNVSGTFSMSHVLKKKFREIQSESFFKNKDTKFCWRITFFSRKQSFWINITQSLNMPVKNCKNVYLYVCQITKSRNCVTRIHCTGCADTDNLICNSHTFCRYRLTIF